MKHRCFRDRVPRHRRAASSRDWGSSGTKCHAGHGWLAVLAGALADPLVPIAVRQRLRDQVEAAVATVRAAAAELDDLQRALAVLRAGAPTSDAPAGGAEM